MNQYLKDPKELGRYFKQLRIGRGVALKDLSEATGIRGPHLWKIERGIIRDPGARSRNANESTGRSKPVLQILCEFFAIPLEELIRNSYLKWYRHQLPYSRTASIQAASHQLSIAQLAADVLHSQPYQDCHTRKGPTMTYLRKYAHAKGYDSLDDCPASCIDVGLRELRAFIDTTAMKMGEHALRNYKNNICFFLRQAREIGLLSRENQPVTLDFELPKLGPSSIQFPSNPNMNVPSYVLTKDELERASTFASQLADYYDFSTNPLRAPRSIRKRHQSMRVLHNKHLLQYAGYLVHEEGWQPAELCFERMVEITNVQKYMRWAIKRTSRKYQNPLNVDETGVSGITRSTPHRLIVLRVLAQYYLKDKPAAEQLKELLEHLDIPERIRRKENMLVPLKELERVGLSLYPFGEARMSDMPEYKKALNSSIMSHMREFGEFPKCTIERSKTGQAGKTFFYGRRLSHRMLFSVIYRFLVRHPLRQRNLREMKLNTNVTKEGNKYKFVFRGPQLKVGRRGLDENKMIFTIEPDGTGFYELFDEWLTVWRPCLMKIFREYVRTPVGKKRLETIQRNNSDIYGLGSVDPQIDSLEDHGYVLVNSNGMPVTINYLTHFFKLCAYRYLGIPLTLHLVRDCWATEYLIKTREENGAPDVVGAAEMLGDTIGTVYEHYAHILGEQAQVRPKKWLNKLLLGDVSADNDKA